MAKGNPIWKDGKGLVGRSIKGPLQACIRREEGVGGLEPKNLCTENNPNQYFLLYFSPHCEIWIRGGGPAVWGCPRSSCGCQLF